MGEMSACWSFSAVALSELAVPSTKVRKISSALIHVAVRGRQVKHPRAVPAEKPTLSNSA